jgi:carbon monoxide dehydrogenase subunit G
MRLGHEQELDAPRSVVWTNFMDLRRIGRCFPGAEVTEVDGDDFVGEITAKLGPLSMYFDGTGSMVERDEKAGRARLTATGQERHGLGKATIDIALTLHPVKGDDDRTRARLVTDLVFLGFPMDFGTGLVQRASDPLIERFLTCMSVSGPVPDADADDDSPLDLVRSATDLFGSFRRDRRERKRR